MLAAKQIAEQIPTLAKSGEHYVSIDKKEDGTEHICLYGVPKGGLIFAQYVAVYLRELEYSVTVFPKNIRGAVIIDDLIDSGKTLEKHLNTDALIMTALRKPHSPKASNLYSLEECDEWVQFPWEENDNDLQDSALRILQYANRNDEGVADTPKRFEKAMKAYLSGYKEDIDERFTVFENEGVDQIVGLSKVKYYSLCEHHLAPFFGYAHIYYVPNEKICGISKLKRVLDHFAHRLQNQERLSKQVADYLDEKLEPRGIAVICSAEHLCMKARGVKAHEAVMKTSELRGVFRTDAAARSELFSLINQQI